MSFSFRSLFPPSTDTGRLSGGAPVLEAPAPVSAPAMQAPPLNASASPFGAPLFKPQAGEQASAAPVSSSGSPFAVPSAGPSTPLLTVADVLPQLPPELARPGSLPPDQPVAVSAQAIDEALRNGRAALPVFEIYRVCPALFQTPVSPQDPRVVPLPAAKLPHLIAAAKGGAGSAGAAGPASPFAAGPGQVQMAAPGASPFSTAPAAGQATPSGVLLPPKRQGPPPPLADVGAGGLAGPVGLPGGPAAAFPVSPFAPSASGFAQTPGAAGGGTNGLSPFGMAAPAGPLSAAAPASAMKPAEPALAASAPVASPFAAASPSPFAAAAPASPFGTSAPAGAAAPAPAPASPFGPAAPATGTASPFAAIFGDKAVPVSPPPTTAAAPPPAFAPAPAASQPSLGEVNGPVRVALAGLLKGYTAAELGFDPMVVPAWITTTLPAHTARELSQAVTPLMELGLLIDGITDIGFRNVLSTARRDFQLRLDTDVLRQALAGNSAPPTLPTLSQLGQPMMARPAAGGPPAAGAMRIDPAAPPGAASFAPPAQPTAFPAAPAAAFTPPALAPEPAAPPPLFTAQMPAAPAPAAPASRPLVAPVGLTNPFGPAQPGGPASGGFMAAPSQPAQDPFAAPARPPPPPAEPPPLLRPAAVEAAPQPAFEPPPVFVPPAPRPAEGFGSDELMREPAGSGMSWSEAAAASAMGQPPPPPRREAPVIDLPPEPPQQAERDEFPGGGWAPPARQPAASKFIPPRVEEDEPAPETRAPRPSPPPAARASAASGASVGIHAHDANPDQIVLRALLDTDADLAPEKVVELVCRLPGIAACVCLHQGRAVSHIGAHKPQAREFQKQATQLASHLRTLAPLIGIEGAETFTMNSGDRLMTFCFPAETVFGVLHDAEPTLGLRDKITLIAREMAKMLR